MFFMHQMYLLCILPLGFTLQSIWGGFMEAQSCAIIHFGKGSGQDGPQLWFCPPIPMALQNSRGPLMKEQHTTWPPPQRPWAEGAAVACMCMSTLPAAPPPPTLTATAGTNPCYLQLKKATVLQNWNPASETR